MSKILNLKIEGNKIEFDIDQDINMQDYDFTFHIDDACNIENIIKNSPEHNITISDVITVDNKKVTVTNDIINNLNWHMKYMALECQNIDTGEEIYFYGIYYNSDVIYHAEIRKLRKHCSTCLDDKTMQEIMIVTFKRQLLDYALAAGEWKEALLLYMDLCRLLEISLDCDKGDYCYNSCCNNCILTQDSRCIHTENDMCLKLQKDNPVHTTMYGCINGCCTI